MIIEMRSYRLKPGSTPKSEGSRKALRDRVKYRRSAPSFTPRSAR